MAFLDFSKTQFIKTVPPSNKVDMGYFKVVEDIHLEHVRVTIYIDGKVPTTERVRLNIYSDPDYKSVLYQSNWADLNQIPVVNRWFGWIRLDFNKENISANYRYYPQIEMDGYAENLGISFIGLAYDYPFPIYPNNLPNFYQHPIQNQIFGMLERGLA